MTTVTICSKNVEYQVLLDDRSDDHVVVCTRMDAKGYEVDVTPGHDTWAWDRAVDRAKRAEAFL